MRLQVWTDFTTPMTTTWAFSLFFSISAYCKHACSQIGSSRLQQCTMLVSAVLRFQLHFTCNASLFLLIEVWRACVLRLCKKVVSVVVIYKIEIARDFYVIRQRISTSWDVCRLLGCSSRAPSAALLLTVASITARNQIFPSEVSLSPRLERSSTSRTPSLKKSLLSPIMPCSKALSNVRNRAFPTSDYHV